MNGPCSQSCGHGIQEYKRTNLVESKNGGLECVGSFEKTESCHIQACPVDCQWTEWQYGSCSRSCGSGKQVILRTEKVKSKNGGRPCFGSSTRTEACYLQDCPVDCQWSAWSKEGECSRSCGGGKQIFIRTERIKAGNGGRPCNGSELKIDTCNNHVCHEPGKKLGLITLKNSLL